MLQSDFITLVQEYSVSLLDASSGAEREAIAGEIADDPELATAVLMLLSEQIFPVLPDVQEGLIQ